MKDHKAYTSAAKLIADLLDDPSIEREVKEKLARRKKINALVSKRAKANLTIREVAKRMGITCRQLHDIEETWEDKDLQDFPKVARSYVKAIRRTKTEGRREVRDIDLSAVSAVCDDCARTLGFTPKNEIIGAWMYECGVCHQRKACTDLHHDWNPLTEGGAK